MSIDTPRPDAPTTGPTTAVNPLDAGFSGRAVRGTGPDPLGERRRIPARPPLGGLGIGWRPELARFIQTRADRLGFVEVVAESVPRRRPARPPGGRAGRPDVHGPRGPDARGELAGVGLPVAVHGVRLSLGGATPPEPDRVRHLTEAADRLGASVVSEHVAFVRAGGLEAGHLLPVPRTRDALAALTRNTRMVMAELDAPFALEHVAALTAWPEDELGEADFLTELLERTGALLLLDLANLHAHVRNHGTDPRAFLDRLPLERVAYAHIAGGVERDGLYHDTHVHPIRPAVVDLVAELGARCAKLPPIMLERDGQYPAAADLDAELASIARYVGPDPAGGRQPRPNGSAIPEARASRPRSAVPALPRRAVVGDRDADRTGAHHPAGARSGDPADGVARLAERQESLVLALVAGGPAPVGMDAGRLAATRSALLRKRAGEVALAWPALSTMDGFAVRFAAFAAGRPPAGPVADGRAFAESALADLGDAARAELAQARLPRRPGAVRVVAGAGRGWHVAVRGPIRGARVFSLVDLASLGRGSARPNLRS